MVPLEEIRKNLGKETMLIGQNQTIKNLKLGKVEKVFLASNCKPSVRNDIEYYCKLNKIPLIILEIPNDELGIVCKKHFAISVICFLK